MAALAARELSDGGHMNLGIGIPTPPVANHIPAGMHAGAPAPTDPLPSCAGVHIGGAAAAGDGSPLVGQRWYER